MCVNCVRITVPNDSPFIAACRPWLEAYWNSHVTRAEAFEGLRTACQAHGMLRFSDTADTIFGDPAAKWFPDFPEMKV